MLCLSAVLSAATRALAGGGVVLQDDTCIITIGFYTAHFTAYQPETSGNREFCEDLPHTGETIFVLDYLHSSLKEVPVSFRIIHDASKLGRFVKWEDVQKIGDLGPHTVFYQPPVIEPSASFRVSMDFAENGDYVGIATAGHPGNDNVYVAVFPFRVGAADFPFAIVTFLLAIAVVAVYLVRLGRIGKTGAESTV